MPKNEEPLVNEEDQAKTLFEQIQKMQSKVSDRYTGFTPEEAADVTTYWAASMGMKLRDKYDEDLNKQEFGQLRQTMDRLATLAAHYPKNSPELAALRENLPDIGKLRKEKLEALREDAARSGMDKLMNDFTGSKKRAAKEELEKMRQSRESLDGRDRSKVVKAPTHSGKGRNIFTSTTNAHGVGTYEERHPAGVDFEHYMDKISVRTKDGVLEGVKIEPEVENNGKVVLVFCGSSNPAERQITPIAENYAATGATVITFNYRGFGKSRTLDSNGKQISTPLSEESIYEDGMQMYKYVRDVLGVSPENIILHGYSLGGAVASHVAANVAEQNKVKEQNGIPVDNSRKLGGVVLQSPISSMYEAAKISTGSSVMAYIGQKGCGEYNTKENMRRLYQNDPDIPVTYISGTVDAGDNLSLDRTKLHMDPKAPFKNASCTISENGHTDSEGILLATTENNAIAMEGRNVQLKTYTIPGREEEASQIQQEQPSI